MSGFKSFGLLMMLIATIMLINPSSCAVCNHHGHVCKADGSMGLCCSGFCYQQVGWETGYCQGGWSTTNFDKM